MTVETCPYCGHDRQKGVTCSFCGAEGYPTASLLDPRRVTYTSIPQSRKDYSFNYTPRQGVLSRVSDVLHGPPRKPRPSEEPKLSASPGKPINRGGDTRNIPKKLRFQILERDGFKCKYCGKGPPWQVSSLELEIDHVVSWADGGRTVPENLITSCRDCNRGKGRHSLDTRNY